MKTKEVIGIDVSKLTIDVCIHSNQLKDCFENNIKGFKKMLVWITKNSKFIKEETLFVFEHTGMYSCKLTNFLGKKEILFCIVPGLEIKRSLGITRGKNDQIDAQRIALYGYRLREELKTTPSSSIEIKKLHSLLTLRLRLVRQRAGFKSSLNEQKLVFSKKDYNDIFDMQQKMIDTLTKQINKIEKARKQIIEQNSELKTIFDLVTSVKGIGTQTAFIIIVYTNNFTKFKTWRKFASYGGIAPFPYQSGTSVRGRTKVSHLANKEIKTALNMCAVCAIQYNPEMKKYYQRRIEKGKSKMSTVNIIRNKLIARVFAVVKRKTPYVNILKYAS